jgi:hypothetical protein
MSAIRQQPLPVHAAADAARRRLVPVQLTVLLRRGRLDRALAEGADPSSTPELARRAEQLTSARRRRVLADGLEQALRHADGQAPRLSSAPPVSRREVRAARAEILRLSSVLRDGEPVAPAGVAQLQLLLTDGIGPLHRTVREGDLSEAARAASEALLAQA